MISRIQDRKITESRNRSRTSFGEEGVSEHEIYAAPVGSHVFLFFLNCSERLKSL